MSASDYFPDIDRVVRVARVWPRIFAEQPGGTLPVAFDGGCLLILCAGEESLAMVEENSAQIVRLLNRLLDGDIVVSTLDAVGASATELLLARDMLALKSWLLDFNIGI